MKPISRLRLEAGRTAALPFRVGGRAILFTRLQVATARRRRFHKPGGPGECKTPFAAAAAAAASTTNQATASCTSTIQHKSSPSSPSPPLLSDAPPEELKKALDKQGPGMLLLEHLNLNLWDTAVGDAFYDDVLGCTRDPRRTPSKTPHHNCGAMTQFHTRKSSNGESYSISDPGVLKDTKFSVVSVDENIGIARVICPYGNRFVLKVATFEQQRYAHCQVTQSPMVEAAVEVPRGTSEEIAEFYETVFGFNVVRFVDDTSGNAGVLVSGGPGKQNQKEDEPCLHHILKVYDLSKLRILRPLQLHILKAILLLFLFDLSSLSSAIISIGEHLAMYIGNFEETFLKCLDRGAVWVNPRFVHLDNVTDLHSARSKNELPLKTDTTTSTIFYAIAAMYFQG
eukprot:jgi/Bigna1/68341/fgenesh1_pg.6_\